MALKKSLWLLFWEQTKERQEWKLETVRWLIPESKWEVSKIWTASIGLYVLNELDDLRFMNWMDWMHEEVLGVWGKKTKCEISQRKAGEKWSGQHSGPT
jgi:hypothetical protein